MVCCDFHIDVILTRSGGYYKEYSKLKRPVGVMLEDTWLLRLFTIVPEYFTETLAECPSTLLLMASPLPNLLIC